MLLQIELQKYLKITIIVRSAYLRALKCLFYFFVFISVAAVEKAKKSKFDFSTWQSIYNHSAI